MFNNNSNDYVPSDTSEFDDLESNDAPDCFEIDLQAPWELTHPNEEILMGHPLIGRAEDKGFRLVPASDTFVLFPRIVVSGNYPPHLLTGDVLRKYILLLHRRNNQCGDCSSGLNDYRKQIGKIGTIAHEKKVKWLISNDFIREKAQRGKCTIYQLCIPPIWDSINKTFVKYSNFPLATNIIRGIKMHFVMLPGALFEAEAGFLNVLRMSRNILSSDENLRNDLLVLIKLYRYYSPTFMGVDFNMVRKENGKLVIHSRMYKDIHMDKDSFIKSLELLVQKNLFIWQDANVYNQRIEFEDVLVCEPSLTKVASDHINKYRKVSVLYPVYRMDDNAFYGDSGGDNDE